MKTRLLRVFDVAKTLKTTTKTILEFLDSLGYDVSRQQMQPVSEDMFLHLLRKFDLKRYHSYLTEHPEERREPAAAEAPPPGGDEAVPGRVTVTPVGSSEPFRIELPEHPGEVIEPVRGAVPPPAEAGLVEAVLVTPSWPQRTVEAAAVEYLPEGAVFAESAPRQTVEERRPVRRPRKPALRILRREPIELPTIKILIPERPVRVEPAAAEAATEAVGAAVEAAEPGWAVTLNNIDLELMSWVVNMSDREKVSLLEELMEGEA